MTMLKLNRRQAGIEMGNIPIRETRLFQECPVRDEESTHSKCPPSSAVYRMPDGTCNNPLHLNWGASFRPFLRFLPPVYDDGLETYRKSRTGEDLPVPRMVSSLVHRKRDRPSNSISLMLMQWGQFLDHDLTFTPQSRGFQASIPKCCQRGGRQAIEPNSRHPDCYPMKVPANDSHFAQFGVTCLEFVRSSPSPRIDCPLGPREQTNQVTSYLDGSQVYGSTKEQEDQLRLFKDGMLRYTPLRHRKPLLPPLEDLSTMECRENTPNLHCFLAGDSRVNEQPGLGSMHTIWMREHNRVAAGLSDVNPHWDDDRLYQEARKIVGAEMQHITYNEWLPLVVGERVMDLFELRPLKTGYYNGYNVTVNPTIANALATAAFRFGHSLVQDQIERCDKNHRIVPIQIPLHQEMMNPTPLHNMGSIDRIVLGLAAQRSQSRDEFVTEQLTNHLFQTPESQFGMDLISLNLWRGRDHGLPPFNEWRERCSLRRARTFSDLLDLMHDDTVGRLRMIYEDVEDIDLFTAGLSERPIVGGLVGPTFTCIIAQQFMNLRRGDRFWYETGGFRSSFKPAQLQEIRKVTMARVICDNLDDIETVQPHMFLTHDSVRNPHLSCKGRDILSVNLRAWKEAPRPPFFPSPASDPATSPSFSLESLRTHPETFEIDESTIVDSITYPNSLGSSSFDGASFDVPRPFSPIDYNEQGSLHRSPPVEDVPNGVRHFSDASGRLSSLQLLVGQAYETIKSLMNSQDSSNDP
ncbi:unnamed protein product [Darwinula stevensoni]|uniref:Uncharacterized protein n=1 Tax=Darwinula stevensoni TaxID=69355 RepID=A0A7R8WYU5_9CRUS|nr:unnamed protein product [Darwinula stevensoni]CAG0879788.1 unnamed protein product [Darwinula stevensoni]